MNLPHVKAVMFDIGGVVLSSPFIAITEYEKERGLPPNYLNVSIASRGSSGAWQRFERGELPLLHFYTAFGRDLADTTSGNRWYVEYCNRKQYVRSSPNNFKLMDVMWVANLLCLRGYIETCQLFARMMRSAMAYDAHILAAIRNIRAVGRWRMIALTNNFGGYHGANAQRSREIPEAELRFLGWQDGPIPKGVRELFDHFYDSSQVGMRKPDPRFYLHACKESGVDPEHVIFLDDIGMNLKTAKQLGMVTIPTFWADVYTSDVPIGGTLQAVKQLENYLGIDLCTDITKGYLGGTKL